MKPTFLTGAVLALSMTAIPAWAGSDTPGASVDKPAEAVASESNADQDIGNTDTHVRAENVEVEELEEHKAEGSEDPAPEGYVTNVPADKIEDDADVGETTPATTADEGIRADDEVPPSMDQPTKAMKTEVATDGELTEADPQAGMANAGETTETVKELVEDTEPGADGTVQAATGGAEPTENWFGCSDEDGSEGGTCEEAETEASPDDEKS